MRQFQCYTLEFTRFDSQTFSAFKWHLKIHLFQAAFNTTSLPVPQMRPDSRLISELYTFSYLLTTTLDCDLYK